MKKFITGMLIASLFLCLCGSAFAGLRQEAIDPNTRTGSDFSVSGAAEHNAAVSDESDTSYVYEIAGTTYEYFGLEDPAAADLVGTISKVKVVARVKTEKAENGIVLLGFHIGSSDYMEDAHTVNGTSWAEISDVWTVNPADSAAWEWSDITSLSARLGLGATATGYTACSEITVYVYRSTNTLNPYGTTGYTTWKAAIDAFGTEAMQNDFTLYVYPGRYTETSAPTAVTADMNGYTFHVKPSERMLYPASSDANTGIEFEIPYTSTAPFFGKTGDTTGGTLIFEGLSIDASGATGDGFHIFSNGTNSKSRMVVRNCVLRGADLTVGNANGVQLNSITAGSAISVYNNFIYDMGDGISIAGFSSSTAGNYIIHNTIVSCADDGIDINGDDYTTLYNNISYDNTGSDYEDVSAAVGYGNLCEDSTCSGDDFSGATSSYTGTMTPNADVSATAFTPGGDGCASGHFECINGAYDATPDDWLSYNGSSYGYETFNLDTVEEQANTHIDYVQAGVQYACDAGSTLTAKVCLDDGTEACSGDIAMTDTNWAFSGWATYDFQQAPSGGDWTWADVADLKLKIGMDSNGTAYGSFGWAYVRFYYETTNGNRISQTITFTDPTLDASCTAADIPWDCCTGAGTGACTSEDYTEYFIASSETDAIDKGVDFISGATLDAEARYQMEDGAGVYTADTSGNADNLTQAGTPAARYDSAEGHSCRNFDGTDDVMYIADASQEAGFPAKAGGSNRDMTVCFWIKPTSGASDNTGKAITGKWSEQTDTASKAKESWLISMYNDSTVQFGRAYNPSGTTVTCDAADKVQAGYGMTDWYWYHYCISYNDTTRETRIRMWDEFTAQTKYPDATKTLSDNTMFIPAEAAAFALGANYNSSAAAQNFLYGWLDDVVVFNTVLTPDQMDMVRVLSSDATKRSRGSTTADINGSGAAPDIGAYEYRTPRDYYIADNGSDTATGLSGASWDSFWNLNHRTLSPGDNVYLVRGDSWSGATLYIRAVGSKESALTNVDITATGTGNKPDISGSDTGMYIISTCNTKISNIEVSDAANNGIYAVFTNTLELENVDVYNCGTSCTSQTDLCGTGILVYGGNGLILDTVTSNWNNGEGVYTSAVDGTTTTNQITDCVFNYNGRAHPYMYSFGYLNGNYNAGNVLGVKDTIYMADTDMSYNGYIGMGGCGEDSIVEGCEANYNGNGMSTQGTMVYTGTMTGTVFSPGEYVKGATSLAVGRVHQCNDNSFAYSGTGTKLSIEPVSGVEFCTAENDPWDCCTGSGTGDCDFDEVAEEIDICSDATAVCSSPSNARHWDSTARTDWSTLAQWSGGGYDIRYSDGSTLRYCSAAGNYFLRTRADAYGFDFDDYSDSLLMHHCIAYANEGAGFEFNNSGYATANKLYNSLAYANTTESTVAGGIYFAFYTAKEVDSKAIVKNCISVNDTLYALVAGSYTDVANNDVILDNNIYFMDSGDIVNWKGTGYTAAEFSDYQAVIEGDATCNTAGNDCYSLAQDPLVYGLDDPENGLRLQAGSPCIDTGADLSTELSCTAEVDCLDYASTVIPLDGPDEDPTLEWDMGPYEWFAAASGIIINHFRRLRE